MANAKNKKKRAKRKASGSKATGENQSPPATKKSPTIKRKYPKKQKICKKSPNRNVTTRAQGTSENHQTKFQSLSPSFVKNSPVIRQKDPKNKQKQKVHNHGRKRKVYDPPEIPPEWQPESSPSAIEETPVIARKRPRKRKALKKRKGKLGKKGTKRRASKAEESTENRPEAEFRSPFSVLMKAPTVQHEGPKRQKQELGAENGGLGMVVMNRSARAQAGIQQLLGNLVFLLFNSGLDYWTLEKAQEAVFHLLRLANRENLLRQMIFDAPMKFSTLSNKKQELGAENGGLGMVVMNRSARAQAGIQFPVENVYERMKEDFKNPLITADLANEVTAEAAAVFMASVMEYVMAEVLELSGNAAKENQKARIEPAYIQVAIRNDEELNELLGGARIHEYQKNIHKVLRLAQTHFHYFSPF